MKKLSIAALAAILAALLLLSACSTIEVRFVFDEQPTYYERTVTEPPTTQPTTQPTTTEPPTTEPISVPNVNTGS